MNPSSLLLIWAFFIAACTNFAGRQNINTFDDDDESMTVGTMDSEEMYHIDTSTRVANTDIGDDTDIDADSDADTDTDTEADADTDADADTADADTDTDSDADSDIPLSRYARR